VRWTAAVALARIDPSAARAALPLFIAKLKSNDSRARWDGIFCLEQMGVDGKAAAPALTDLTLKGEPLAAMALTTVAGREATAAIPLLTKVLMEGWDTAEALAKIGPPAVPRLLELLQTGKVSRRPLIVKTLGMIGAKHPDVVPTLIRILNDPTPAMRQAAIDALTGMSPKVHEVVPALSEKLKDKEAGIRLAAAAALLAIQGREARAAVPTLVELLAQPDIHHRRTAVGLLGDLGATAKEALPALTRARTDVDGGVRTAAAWAIAKIQRSEAAQAAAAVMMEALTDKDATVRKHSIRCLAQVGPDARSAIPALVKAFQEDTQEVSNAAAEALRRIDPEAAVKAGVR
jgi:HEAT repeat protein